jgi:MFS family permease
LFLFGVANTANQQARFAAADVVPDERRARAVGVVVWSTTIGVVLGPILSGPLGRAVKPLGIPEYGGSFLVGGFVFVLASGVCWTMLRPDPLEVSREIRPVVTGTIVPDVDVRACLRRPIVRMALLALVIGQVVMVGIMSTTSVHLKDHGHSTGSVGVTISLHVLGMYAATPLTGWLSDRLGRIPVIAGGGLLLAVAGLLAAAAPPEGSFAIDTALFLLGLGWNMNFVAGSALLTDGVTPAERPRMQGSPTWRRSLPPPVRPSSVDSCSTPRATRAWPSVERHSPVPRSSSSSPFATQPPHPPPSSFKTTCGCDDLIAGSAATLGR